VNLSDLSTRVTFGFVPLGQTRPSSLMAVYRPPNPPPKIQTLGADVGVDWKEDDGLGSGEMVEEKAAQEGKLGGRELELLLVVLEVCLLVLMVEVGWCQKDARREWRSLWLKCWWDVARSTLEKGVDEFHTCIENVRMG